MSADDISICEVCRQPTLQQCMECNSRYCCSCNEEHCLGCKSFETCESSNGSFFLKAARDLHAGEVILRELPSVVWPKLPTKEGFLPCVRCCRLVQAEKSTPCSECLWPSCDFNCEDQLKEPKHSVECTILKLQSNFVTDTSHKFDMLLPLRLLIVQSTNKVVWQKLENLFKNTSEDSSNSNNNDRDTNSAQSEFNQDFITFLEENYLVSLQEQAKENGSTILEKRPRDLLQRISNHIEKNYFEHNFVKLFYISANHLEHACTPNSFHTIDPNTNEITILANCHILKHNIITISHVNLFEATPDRLQVLSKRKIRCECPRCQDPTEFGTFFGALRCLGSRKEPCNGTQLPLAPTNPETLWVCDRCKIELPNDQMLKFIQHLKNELDKILLTSASVDDLEEFLAKLLLFLHPNHSYICRVKYALLGLYGEDLINTKMEICKNLLDVVRKLCPNGGFFVGELMHVLFGAKCSCLEQVTNKEELRRSVEEVESLLNELKRNVRIARCVDSSRMLSEDEQRFQCLLNLLSY